MSKSPFLVVDFNIKSVKEDDPDFFIVEGWASVYGNVDLARDICEKGCFTKDLLENGNTRSILWQHKRDEPIGIGIFEDKEEGLWVAIKLPKDDDFVVKRVMPQVRVGSVKGLSIGYRTIKEEWSNEERVNRLKELKLLEVSAVTFPCNELAQITAAKEFLGLESSSEINIKNYPLADEKTEWIKSDAISDIKTNTGSVDKPSKNYGNGFLITNPDKKDDYSGFELPYVKFIDGEFRIVPHAIFKATGQIASGKFDLSDEADIKLKDYINTIYKKLGKEEPFKGKSIFIDTATLKNMEDQDKEIIFNPDVILSTGAKSEIIKSLRSPAQGGSVTEEKTDLLKFLKKANEDMKINK